MPYFSGYDAQGNFTRVAYFLEEFRNDQVLMSGEAGLLMDHEADWTNEYYDSTAEIAAAKSAMPLAFDPGDGVADGVTVYSIAQIPAPTKVLVTGPGGPIEPVTVTDGSLELTFDMAGDYLLYLTSTKFITEKVTLHAA